MIDGRPFFRPTNNPCSRVSSRRLPAKKEFKANRETFKYLIVNEGPEVPRSLATEREKIPKASK